jgi:hypothetical protein
MKDEVPHWTGVYEVTYRFRTLSRGGFYRSAVYYGYSWWDGSRWGRIWIDVAGAAERKSELAQGAVVRWRGVQSEG